MKLEELYKIGKKTAFQLRQNNIWTPYDLVMNFPKSYENYNIIDFSTAKHLDVITVVGVVLKIESFTKNINIIKLLVKVEEFQVTATIFNQPFILKTIKLNDVVLIKGKYNLFKNEINVSVISKNLEKLTISPVYQIDGVSNYTITEALKNIFENNLVPIYETLPPQIIKKHQLLSRKEMIKNIHHPTSIELLEKAIKRLKYEEAISIQLRLQKNTREFVKRDPINYQIEIVKDFIDNLGYELTIDQKEAVNEIYRDFKKDYKIKRLVQGDVGSGKTIVAIIAALGVITAHQQVVMMVPTEILANQHYETIKNLLPNYNVSLLTRKTKNRLEILVNLKDGKIDFLIGTHAVANELVDFYDLGLVIIDEQHKFGVEIRENLMNKANTANLVYLTATPIPRTLGIAMFGDILVSSINTRPTFQQQVVTKYYQDSYLDEILEEVKEVIVRKEHVFIVVPAITSNIKTYNIYTTTDLLKPLFGDKLFILHGDMNFDVQNEVISKFYESNGGILLSTSIIEVGINLKSATLMVVLGAENFGLSQLHQFRGRVGRGEKKSKFYAVSEHDDIERLQILEKINDGFTLSEYDLKLRGPGDFLGIKQSGVLESKYLDYINDYQILVDAREISLDFIGNSDLQKDPSYYYLKRILTED